MAFLELHQITKSYFLGKEEFPVLKGIDLSFEKGEFVSILGESGGGKSTLMNIIGGLDRDFKGEVVVNGQLLNHHDPKQLDNYRRQTVGYIFQSFNLINYQTNLQNVETALNMTTLTAAERHERAKILLRKVGLAEHIHKYPSQLSGGQKQRVAVARALAGDPDIIIADEPTGALDSANTAEVLVLLNQIAKEGKLVIMVTHSKEVAYHGSRVLFMADGHIAIDKRLDLTNPVPTSVTKLQSKVLSRGTVWSMAFEHLRYNALQSFLIILGSAIGVFSVILFLGLGSGVKSYINQQVSQLANPDYPTVYKNLSKDNKLTPVEKIETTQRVMDTSYAEATLGSDYLDKLAKIPHVDKVYPAYMFGAANYSYGDTKIGGTFRSWGPNFSTQLIKKGREPLHRGEMVVAKSFAEKIGSDWTKAMGKVIQVSYTAFDTDNKPITITTQLKVVGITDGNQTANVWAATFDEIKSELEDAGATTEATYAVAKVDKTNNVKETVKKINSAKIGDMNAFTAASLDDTLATIYKITNLATYVLASISGISLAVSAIMIIVTTYMSVAERTKEIGVLRALGARQSDIRHLFTNESILMALIACALGTVMSFAGQLIMNKALYSLITYNIVHISWINIVEAVSISIAITYAATFVPSRKAARLNTIDALASD